METLKKLSEIDPKDLPTLERLIGVPLDPSRHEAVVVRVVPVVGVPSDATVAGTLPDWCNVLDGFSDEDLKEFDAILADRPKLSHEFDQA